MPYYESIANSAAILTWKPSALGSVECSDCRMEMYLISRKDQIVSAAGHTFGFRAGEPLHTENSHKFTVETFTSLAADGGWSVSKTWLSEAPQVGLVPLEPTQQEVTVKVWEQSTWIISPQ